MRDCRTCEYGKYNDHWDMSFCTHPKGCKDFNLYKKRKGDNRGRIKTDAGDNHSEVKAGSTRQ